MAKKKYSIAQQLASLAILFLAGFITFAIGFGVAQLDSMQSLVKYIVSGQSLADMLPYANDPLDKQITVWSAVPDALKGGAILMGPEYSNELGMILINQEGQILHKWNLENRIFNPPTLDWWKSIPTNEGFAVDDARLLPGGDLIFIQLEMSVNAYRGQRLARMDKDSHILWQVPGNFHHFLDIAGDPQRIYALSSSLRDGFPEAGPPLGNVRYLEDYIECYSLDGKKIDKWSILDGFVNSPYKNWLSSFEINLPSIQRIILPDGRVLYDLLHPNSLQYLDAAKAKALPFAQEGDILLSFRDLSAIAVFRPSVKQIVWASKGPWREQHNAHVGEDDRLYIFDNEGRLAVVPYTEMEGPHEQKLSRVIRYNPFNNQMDEIYASQELFSFYLGNYEPLGDGSWIISAPQRGRVYVISPEKKIVWKLRTVPDLARFTMPHRKEFSMMHYYPASALQFLDSAKKAAH